MPDDKDKRKTELTEEASDDVNDEEDEEVKEAIKSLVGDDADDQVQDNPDEESEDESPSSSSSSSESEEEEDEEDNSRETNIRQFSRLLDKLEKERQEEMKEEDEYETLEEQYDFPEDPEKWTEADLQEYWADAPETFTKPGWDPITADKDDWDAAIGEVKEGRDPPIAPFYVPFHKSYPAIPDNHYDIKTPKAVIEELDRIEEFLKWVSVIFRDGSSYEGTVWDDLAHGKGVYVAERGLVRYEGEWFRNAMEGHGILEVDIPDIQPRPGSKLEVQMRSEGKIISTDYMSPEDKKWLEMDIEDSLKLAGGHREIPFYENDAWVKVFGEKPEKGRYKYAGQMKHGRMHGCGVYEVNERVLYGRFYFGEYLDSATGCDADISALHAGIAEVAAAKARMFANKPDGMVREDRGPYSDPQHPYFYEQDDVWMAPGFINQFYEVPDYWKTYVEDVDQEREMWLNSFYKAPLRIPMPAELEYWWEKDESPEFILINKEPEPDPEDPSKLVYTEDPLILHTRSGRLINYVDDEKYGVRLFWQPPLKEGEDIDPGKVQFLPVGFDEYYGRAKPTPKKENWLVRLVSSVENALKPMLDKIEKWTDEKKKESELNLKLIETELELVEAEICLEEEVKDLEMLLKKKQQEEEKAAALEDADTSVSGGMDQIDLDEGQEEVEDEEAPSSFGTVSSGDPGQGKQVDAKNGSQPTKSPFSSLSLFFGSSNVVSAVPNKLRESFMSRKEGKQADTVESNATLQSEDARCVSICYPQSKGQQRRLQAGQLAKKTAKRTESRSRLNSLARILWSGTLKDEPPKLKQNTHPFQLNLMSIDAPLVNSL